MNKIQKEKQPESGNALYKLAIGPRLHPMRVGTLQCFVEVALMLFNHHRTPISSFASRTLRKMVLSADRTYGPGASIYVGVFVRTHFSDWARSEK